MRGRLRSSRSAVTSIAFVLACVFGVSAALGAHASGPDWPVVSGIRTIEALTHDDDGSSRETKIWLAVLDGRGYIRTSHSTHWGENVVRNPDLRIRIGEREYPVHATFIEDEALRTRIVEAFRAKYGTTDWFLQIFRGGHPHLMRLDPSP